MSALEKLLSVEVEKLGIWINKAAALRNLTEYACLDGKREGLKLALEYVRGTKP